MSILKKKRNYIFLIMYVKVLKVLSLPHVSCTLESAQLCVNDLSGAERTA